MAVWRRLLGGPPPGPCAWSSIALHSCTKSTRPTLTLHCTPALAPTSAFWMSLAIFTTLGAGGVFTAPVTEGDRLMLTLWGILVSMGWAERLGLGLQFELGSSAGLVH